MKDKIVKELNGATEYLRAMKRAKTANKEDCDNVMMHLGNIEDLMKSINDVHEEFERWEGEAKKYKESGVESSAALEYAYKNCKQLVESKLL